MISIIDEAATMPLEAYNPNYVIKVVNALLPLGKEKALEYIHFYLDSLKKGKDVYGLFWVLRVLFEVPIEQGFPPVRIGKPNIPPPAIQKKFPRFPIVIIKDIPFMVVKGYYLAGLPESVESHLAYFQTHGSIRKELLTPPESMAGIEEEFLQRWKDAYGDAYTTEVLEIIKVQMAMLSDQ